MVVKTAAEIPTRAMKMTFLVFLRSCFSSIDWRCLSQICWKFRQSFFGTLPIFCCSETAPRDGGWGGDLDAFQNESMREKVVWMRQNPRLFTSLWRDTWIWMLLRMSRWGRKLFEWDRTDTFMWLKFHALILMLLEWVDDGECCF